MHIHAHKVVYSVLFMPVNLNLGKSKTSLFM